MYEQQPKQKEKKNVNGHQGRRAQIEKY